MSNMNTRLGYIKCGCGEHKIVLNPAKMEMECENCKRVWDIVERLEEGKEKGRFHFDLKKMIDELEY